MKKTPKKADKRINLKPGKHILTLVLPWLVLSMAGTLAILFFVYQSVLIAPVEKRQAAYDAALIRGYVKVAESNLIALAEQVRLVANLPEVQSALQSQDSVMVKDIEKKLAFSLKAKHGLRLLPPTLHRVDPDSQPPINNIILDLIRSAVEKNMSYPEVMIKQGGEKYLALVHPVFHSRQHIGNVLVGFDVEHVQAQLDKGETFHGFLELLQDFGQRKDLVAKNGDPRMKIGAPLSRQKIGQSNWRINYWPSNKEKINFEEGISSFLMLSLMIFLVITTAFLIAFFSVHKRLEKDASKLTQILVDVIGRRFDIPPKAFSLSLFFDIASPLSRASKELHATPATTPPKPARPRARRKAEVSSQPPQENTVKDNQPKKAPAAGSSKPVSASNQAPKVVEKIETPNLDQALDFEVSHNSDIDPNIFRAYDIRGIVDESLTESVVEEIGKAIGSEAYERGEQTVIVARDGRLSGPKLIESLKAGLKASGRDVIDLGVVPTPVLYFATNKLEARSGVMLTGSHNPPNYNGLKMVIAGETLSGDDIKALYQRIDSGNLMSGKGNEKSIDVTDEYIEEITGDIALAQPLKVAVDCGNGVAGVIAQKLLEALGCEVIPLYFEVDGNFPNHHPDPSKPENLRDLIQAVMDNSADIGVAFDGDGDRLGVVTSEGKVIYPDRQLMLFAIDVLSRNPGADILFDVKCTRNLPQVISGHGGRPLMWKTGHSFMKAKMKETGALLGGECSGHIFFKERWYGFDDALYSCARLLEILGNDFRSSSQIFDSLPDSVATPEINVALPDSEKFAFIDKMVAKAEFGDAEVNTIDGLRVDFSDGWGLVRASNTTPNLVIRFEADNEPALAKIQAGFKEKLKAINPNLELPF